jgi:WD40 repeat protein
MDDSKQKYKHQILKDYFKDQELKPEIFDDYTKTPCKVLAGHNRAVRELAYSKIHKIIVSVGFDFTVYVWNPYLENYIIKLDEHENPLVGVNCLPTLGQFVTADSKGIVKVWNIRDYSCI